MKRVIAAVALTLALAGCTVEPAPVAPAPTISHEFLCEQIRSGSTIEDIMTYEQEQGLDKRDSADTVIKAVNKTCPEFKILIAEYFTD